MGVPEDKIRMRYEKAMKLIPELVKVEDVMHIYFVIILLL